MLIGLTAGAIALTLNLYTFKRLSDEQPRAELSFRQIAPQRFAVVLHQPGQPDQQTELSGDEWPLDARALK